MPKPLAVCGFIALVLLSLPSLLVSGGTVGLYAVLELLKVTTDKGAALSGILESYAVICAIALVLSLVGIGLYGGLTLALLGGRRRLAVVAGVLAMMVQGYIIFGAVPVFIAAQAKIQGVALGGYLTWCLLSMAIIVVMVALGFRPTSATPLRCVS